MVKEMVEIQIEILTSKFKQIIPTLASINNRKNLKIGFMW